MKPYHLIAKQEYKEPIAEKRKLCPLCMLPVADPPHSDVFDRSWCCGQRPLIIVK